MRTESTQVIRVVMNGVTGRMGYNQHPVRSVLAINDDGGCRCPAAPEAGRPS